MKERGKLLDEIDVEATGSVARLRGFVLDLAVRGRLLPQLSSEGSASSLVAALRGVDRKRDPANEQEPPFDLPASWTWSTVGSVSSYVQRGKGPDYVEASAVPVVSQKCVQWEGFLIERARFIDPKSLSAYGEERMLRDGDLLWNSTGHGTVGRVAVFRSDPRYPRVVADSHVTIVRPEIEPRFLWCWLASPTVQRTIDDLVSGTTKQTELSTSTVVAHPVPVPPLAEQKRIVAKVDQLLALCDELESRQTEKRETSIRLTKSALYALTTAEGPEEFDLAWKRVVENFDVLIDRGEKVGELRSSILRLACTGALAERVPAEGDANEVIARLRSAKGSSVRRGVPESVEPPAVVQAWKLPEHWIALSVADLLRAGELVDVKDGNHGANHPLAAEYVAAGAPFIMASNVHDEIDYENAKKLPANVVARLRVGFAKPGDVIFTHKGTVGRVAINTRDCILTPQTTYYRVRRPTTLLDPEFLCIVLKSPHHQEQLAEVQAQTTRDFVPVSRQYTAFLPVPPLSEQRRIVDRVRLLTGLCDEIEALLIRAEDRASKLVEAVVQDLVA